MHLLDSRDREGGEWHALQSLHFFYSSEKKIKKTQGLVMEIDTNRNNFR